MGCPLGLAYQLDLCLTNAGKRSQPVFDLFKNLPACRALWRGERYRHFHALPRPSGRGVRIGLERDSVDQAQIDNIELYFGVEAVAQRGEDVGFNEHGLILPLNQVARHRLQSLGAAAIRLKRGEGFLDQLGGVALALLDAVNRRPGSLFCGHILARCLAQLR